MGLDMFIASTEMEGWPTTIGTSLRTCQMLIKVGLNNGVWMSSIAMDIVKKREKGSGWDGGKRGGGLGYGCYGVELYKDVSYAD
jgi:hypothetical protein